jgi:hypothetical protein
MLKGNFEISKTPRPTAPPSRQYPHWQRRFDHQKILISRHSQAAET